VKRIVVAAALVLLACPSEPSDKVEAKSGASEPSTTTSKSPSDEAGVLALLAPMPIGDAPESPDNAIELRYTITGPGGLAGEWVVLQKAGGWRSEAWTMKSNDALEVSGRTIATPRTLWTSSGEQPGEQTTIQLGALADAWLALPSERRDAALLHLREWRDELAKSRLEQPGEGETIAGVRCVKMRIAAQNLCLWEEAGVLMRYEGAAFELQVSALDRNPSIPADAFELPARAKDATPIAAEPIDAKALVEGLAEGKVAPIAALLAPGLRLPALTKQASATDEAPPAN